MIDIVEELREYVRAESPIWDLDVFNEMKNAWPNQNEITLYRGINFKSKESYDNFLDSLNENGGYIQNSASSFSADEATAEGFAIISKSYFLNKEVMKANSVQNTLGERIAGYKGVVLKVTVPANYVVDVQKSGEAIENEYLFEPGKIIKVEVRNLKSFYEITQEPGFDVNKVLEEEILKIQLKKESVLNNKWVSFLLINHADEISKINKTMICQNDFMVELKRREQLTEKDINSESNTLLSHQKEVSVTMYKTYNSSRGDKKPDEIHIQPISFSNLDSYDLITPDFKKIITKVASEVLQVAMETHLKYRDDKSVRIEYSDMRDLVTYLNDDDKSLYSRMINYGVKQSYEDLNKKIGANFSDYRKRSSAIEDMKNFLNTILASTLPSKGSEIKEKENRKKAIQEAKAYRAEMFGIIQENQTKNSEIKFKIK